MDDGRIRLFVETFAGQRVAVDVSKQDTVAVLKQGIEQRTGIAALSQKLSYAGKPMMDNVPISSFCVQNGSTIAMATPVNGG
jgi:phage I-like protein